MSAPAFMSIHHHGMVRVAAATPPVATADPARNAEATIALARQGDAEGVDLVVFPELGLSSYAIDDLLLQDALLDAAERAVVSGTRCEPRAGAGTARRRTPAPQRQAVQQRGRRCARRDPRRRTEDVPTQLSRVLRKALVRLRRRHRGTDDPPRRCIGSVRHRPDLRRERRRRVRDRRRDLRGLLVGDPAVVTCCPGRRNRPGESLGVEHHRGQGRRS